MSQVNWGNGKALLLYGYRVKTLFLCLLLAASLFFTLKRCKLNDNWLLMRCHSYRIDR